MIFALIILSCQCFSFPRLQYLEDRVDVIEINHYFDDQALPIFDQVIFWRFYTHLDEYHIVAWRILKDVRDHKDNKKWIGGPNTPYYDFKKKQWVMLWWDHKHRVNRKVIAVDKRETWTQHDPELADREFLPQEYREGLSKRDDFKDIKKAN
jgi:hypothetical protein